MMFKKVSPIIFSRDCHGFQYYKMLNIKYNSPTIGNCIRVHDFIKLLKFLEDTYYFDINKKDIFRNIIPSSIETVNVGGTIYPIGNIRFNLNGEMNNINVHFQHENNKDVIMSKWIRRMERFVEDLNPEMNNVFFFLNDADLKECTEPFHYYVKQFLNIKIGKKILFCKQNTFNDIFNNLSKETLQKGHIIIVPDYCNDGVKIYNYIIKANLLNNIFNVEKNTNHTMTIIGKRFSFLN